MEDLRFGAWCAARPSRSLPSDRCRPISVVRNSAAFTAGLHFT
jgi:hypothetical protein